MKYLSLQSLPELLSRLPGLCAALAILGAFTYGVLLLMTVVHAASTEEAQAHIHSLSTSLARSESQYLERAQAITPETVTRLGFVAPTEVATIYSDAGVHTLSLKVGN